MLVGSRALQYHTGSFQRPGRVPDYDIWLPEGSEEVVSYPTKNVELSYMPINIMNAFSETSRLTQNVDPNDVMTIKMSHLPWDIKWKKHMCDYLVLKSMGCIVNQPLLDLLRDHWKNIHGTKTHLSLYRTKDKFFDDFVTKKYDHDYLHELVAHPNPPVYTYCLKDGEQVAIDKSKFDSLPRNQQIKMFREEINVIAIERWMLNGADIPFIHAYNRAFHKTVTALTKGWASEFLIENALDFFKPNKDEVDFCLNKLELI